MGSIDKTFDIHNKRILFIVNPTACHNTCAAIIPEIEAFCAREGLDYKLVCTEAPKHATELAREAAADFDVITAVGGDGTVHEVANGILQATLDEDQHPRTERKAPYLALIPIGSGNDYARTLDVASDKDRRIEQLLSMAPASFDVGICNGEYYLETFSVGIDADIANRTISLREENSTLSGTPLYLRAAFDVFTKLYRSIDLEVETDEGTHTGSYMIFASQIGPTYGGGFPISTKADPSDGLFDVVLANPMKKLPCIALFLKVMQGKHEHRTDIFTFLHSTHVHVKAAEELRGQLDGEPWAYTEFDLRLLPGVLRVLRGPEERYR